MFQSVIQWMGPWRQGSYRTFEKVAQNAINKHNVSHLNVKLVLINAFV